MTAGRRELDASRCRHRDGPARFATAYFVVAEGVTNALKHASLRLAPPRRSTTIGDGSSSRSAKMASGAPNRPSVSPRSATASPQQGERSPSRARSETERRTSRSSYAHGDRRGHTPAVEAGQRGELAIERRRPPTPRSADDRYRPRRSLAWRPSGRPRALRRTHSRQPGRAHTPRAYARGTRQARKLPAAPPAGAPQRARRRAQAGPAGGSSRARPLEIVEDPCDRGA